MNSENSKTSEPYVLTLKLTDKLGLRRGEKSSALSNLSIYYTWNNKFELSDGSYSVSDIPRFWVLFKKSLEKTSITPQKEYM